MSNYLAERTHCANGHLYDEANTKYIAGYGRRCRECARVRAAARRAARRGGPSTPSKWMSEDERWAYRLDRSIRVVRSLATPCIEWSGTRDSNGYGQIRLDGRTRRAHRIAWIKANGPIPDGLLVCHRCDNPPCINPDHLFLGTHTDNMRDMIAKGRRVLSRPNLKTHCQQGHPFDETNTYIAPKTGKRGCRKCRNAATAASKRRVA